jgi:hypothetical protein
VQRTEYRLSVHGRVRPQTKVVKIRQKGFLDVRQNLANSGKSGINVLTKG